MPSFSAPPALICSVILSLTFFSGFSRAADPAPNLPEPYRKSHESFVNRAKQGNIDLLFLGDDIVRRWSGSRNVWNGYFGMYPNATFAIDGDDSQRLLWRIQNGELDRITPKVIVVVVGANELKASPEQTVDGTRKIVQEIHRRIPTAKVLVIGVLPQGAEANDPLRSKVKAINDGLAKLADKDKTRFVDIGRAFVSGDGKLVKQLIPDGIHPSDDGYDVMSAAAWPVIDEMMR